MLEEAATKHREWSGLPIEIFEEIAKHVESISDFIRFRSVCKKWREAAAQCKLRRRQPPIHICEYNVFNPDRYFFSLTTRRLHYIPLPQLVGKRILDTTNGWMLLHDVRTRELSLHNPISMAYIRLPPSREFVKGNVRGRLFYDQFVDNYLVLFLDKLGDTIWFCKVGDESWSALSRNNIDVDFRTNCFYLRIIYHKGKFFANWFDLIYIIDVSVAASGQWLSAGSPISDIPEYGDHRYPPYTFLVTFSGELFLVFDFFTLGGGVLFYEFDLESPQFKWSKVELQNYALFTWVEHPFMCCVKDFPGFKKKCVYPSVYSSQIEILVFDCEAHKTDRIRCGWTRPVDFNERSLWITPTFQ